MTQQLKQCWHALAVGRTHLTRFPTLVLSFVMAARLELGILRAVWLEAYGMKAVLAGSGREMDGISRFSA